MTYTKDLPLTIVNPLTRTTNNGSDDFTRLRSFNGSRTGSKVENRKVKMAEGLSASSPYFVDHARVERMEYGDSTLLYYSPFSPNQIFRDDWSGIATPIAVPNHGSVDVSAVDEKALLKIYNKIKAERVHMNGQTFLGELSQTIKMLRSPYKEIIRLVNEHLGVVRRARSKFGTPNKRSRKEYQQAIAGAWLETNFGLRPLISDVKDIAETIARLENPPPKRARVVAREFQGDSSVVQVTDAPGGVGEMTRYLRVQRDTTIYRVQYVVGLQQVTTVASSATQRLIELSGLNTLENFVPALWNVLPWSFLFDYVSNIGDIIEAGTTDTSEVRWINLTRTFESTRVIECHLNRSVLETSLADFGYRVQEFGSSSGHLGKATLVRRTVTRTIPPTLGLPPLRFNLPERGMQAANIVALWLGNRKRLEIR